MVLIVQVSLLYELLIHFQITKVWGLINFNKMFDDIIRGSVDQYYYQSNYSMLLQLFLNLFCLDIAFKNIFIMFSRLVCDGKK